MRYVYSLEMRQKVAGGLCAAVGQTVVDQTTASQGGLQILISDRASKFFIWAGIGLSTSVGRSMNSCRLGGSERLAVYANITDVRRPKPGASEPPSIHTVKPANLRAANRRKQNVSRQTPGLRRLTHLPLLEIHGSRSWIRRKAHRRTVFTGG